MKDYEYCLRCGRKLRSQENRERGMGKVCWEKSQLNPKHPPLFKKIGMISVSKDNDIWYFSSPNAMSEYLQNNGKLTSKNRFRLLK